MWYQGVPKSEMGCKNILLMPGGIVGEVSLGRKGNYSEAFLNDYRVVSYKSVINILPVAVLPISTG